MERINWLFHSKNLHSVVINDLNLEGVATLPVKYYPPLIIIRVNCRVRIS